MHDKHRGGGSDSNRLAELEERALQAWMLDDTDLVPLGFADRVLAADSIVDAPIIVPEAIPVAAPVSGTRSWTGTAARMAVAMTVAALAGGITVGRWSKPATPLEPIVDVAGRERTTSPLTDDRPRAELRHDGTPGRPVPVDLDAQVRRYIADYGQHWGPAFRFHGVIVVGRRGLVEYARGFGVARPETGTPNGPGTRFRLGMLTEQFTAAAILQLRDRGLLELDEPIAKFLPEVPGSEAITIEHLLSHRSGLPDYTSVPGFDDWKSSAHGTGAMIERIAELPRHARPGETFHPSNSGYYLLGAIVERVTGQSLRDYMSEAVLEPIGMRATLVGDAFETGEQAEGQVWNDAEVLVPPASIDLSVFGGAGAMVSSALDLIKWDAALHDGTVLAESSAAEMLRPHAEGYGYGFVLSEGYGQPVASFPGVIDGYNNAMIRFLADETLIVVLGNNEVLPAMRIAEDVAAMVYGDTPSRRIEHHEIEIAPGTLPRFTGTYALSHETRGNHAATIDPAILMLLDRVHVREMGDRLYLDLPDYGVSWMHPMGQNRFFFKDHAGTTVSFNLGRDKRATQLTLQSPDGSFALDRIASTPER